MLSLGSLVSVKEKLVQMESEKKRLTHDNSSLYEKIRYLQNYSQSSKPSQRYSGHIESIESGKHMMWTISCVHYSPVSKISLNVSTVHAGNHNNQMQQSMDLSSLEYSNVYEQKMSPVAMFSQLERQKKLKDLTVIERILLSSTVQSKWRCDVRWCDVVLHSWCSSYDVVWWCGATFCSVSFYSVALFALCQCIKSANTYMMYRACHSCLDKSWPHSNDVLLRSYALFGVLYAVLCGPQLALRWGGDGAVGEHHQLGHGGDSQGQVLN